MDSATIGKKEIILTSNGTNQSFQIQNNTFIGTFSNIKLQEYEEEQPYQNSNSWSGIPIGDYCLAVKDNFGCEISIPFTIDAFTPNLVDYDAVLEVSKVNSLQFKENEAWANCGIRPNFVHIWADPKSCGLKSDTDSWWYLPRSVLLVSSVTKYDF